MTRLALAMMAILILASPGLASQSKGAAAEPLEVLMHCTQVDDAAVGAAGSRSERYAAFVALWNQDESALDGIDELLERGTIAGRIYGLILLERLDPDRAAEAASRLKTAGGEVNVLQGCLMMKYPVSELADRIVNGGYVIKTPALTVK